MIIDFHAHVFPPRFRENRQEYVSRDATFAALFSRPGARMATAEELVAAMDEAGVDVAVAMGVGWRDRATAQEANDYILGAVNKFPGRLLGMCSANPAWGWAAVAEVERCAGPGMVGVGEMHPDTQGFDLGDQDVMDPLMEAARSKGLIVLTHGSEPVGHIYPGKGKTTPQVLYPFLRAFPENTVVCAHWGGGLPFYYLMPEIAQELPKVYFDTAASPLLYTTDVFPTVEAACGPGRILFGSDFPLVGYGRPLHQVREAPISQGSRDAILGDNARVLLGRVQPGRVLPDI